MPNRGREQAVIQRFQIEDIVIQDVSGVVFRALDTETGLHVALRRFFPRGPKGPGLTEYEQIVYAELISRLSEIKHPSLRSVIAGGYDPVDGMPYIATEWVDGTRLEKQIELSPLSGKEAVSLLDSALEVCEFVSDFIGHESVWVETDPRAIVVAQKKDRRGFTFWISPMQWIGERADRREFHSIALLADEVVWQNASRDSRPLRRWSRWLRKNPSTSLKEVRERLAHAYDTPPGRNFRLIRLSGANLFLAFAAALFVATCGWGGWVLLKHQPAEQVTPTPSSVRSVSSMDRNELLTLEGQKVILTGACQGVQASPDGEGIQLLFSPLEDGEAARAELNQSMHSGAHELDVELLIGKNLRVHGTVVIESTANTSRPVVMLDSHRAIEVTE